MKIYLLRKEKGRIYKSEDIIKAAFGKDLTHDSKGAPLVSDGYISISDTSGYWACVFSERPVGLDMEESSRPVKPAVARKLHKEEQEYLAPLEGVLSEWKAEFLSIWTKKEAAVKLCGKGLSAGFSGFSVLSPESVDSLAACSIASVSGEGLSVKLAGFAAGGLVFGVASLEEGELTPYAVVFDYDAPMERTALEAAADMLDMRGYSSSKLSEKLAGKGYTKEETAEAVERLQDYGYLNDRAMAESLAEKYAGKGYSSSRIEFELKNKGIPNDIAAASASEYKETDRERARSVYNSMKAKAPADADPGKEKARAARKLSSLGYGATVIYSLLD